MYHISRHYLGTEFTFNPQTPICTNEVENEMPERVCASPTVEQCWDAIKGCRPIQREVKRRFINGLYFFVYEFSNTETFFENRGVKDFDKTQEHISLTPVKAVLKKAIWCDAYKLDRDYLFVEDIELDEAVESYGNFQKDLINEIESIL